MTNRLLHALDWTAHLLYEPALLGRRSARIPSWRKPFHAIHLIPASLLTRICNAYDASSEADRSDAGSRA